MGYTHPKAFKDQYHNYNPEKDAHHLCWRLLPEGAALDEVVEFMS